VASSKLSKLAIASRAKLGVPPDHVRLVLTLELRRALAEQLSAQAIRSLDLLAARPTTSAERNSTPVGDTT